MGLNVEMLILKDEPRRHPKTKANHHELMTIVETDGILDTAESAAVLNVIVKTIFVYLRRLRKKVKN